MNVSLYKTPDAAHKLNKTTTEIQLDIDAKITTPFNILRPMFTLDYTAARAACNYVYIPAFNRWYFCQVTMDSASRLHFACEVDALMSWRSSIKQCTATVIRNGTRTTDIIDTKLPIPKINYIESHYLDTMDYPESAYQYAVTVYGGE